MPRRSEPSPAVAVLLSRRHADTDERDAEASLDELEQLLRGLGVAVARRVVQRRKPTGNASFVGAGKQQEVAAAIEEVARLRGRDAVVLAVDDELRPGQQHQLETALDVPVIDRTGVVLRVFEQRAQTPLARLEVEIARLAYEAPRVRDDASLGDREGGGGRGGRGHTNVELEKQRIRKRLAALRRERDELAARDESQRARREGLRVALVGYTNAGKSSLMRALTRSDVLVDDKLFATLSSTVRALSPAATPPIMVSDTVGFLRNLPHELVASFRSTLAEARDADLLLHVVDASDPSFEEQMRVTRESIASIGGAEVRELVVLNKIDRLGDEARAALARALPGAIQVSALDRADVARLRQAIVDAFDPDLDAEVLSVPFADGHLLGDVRSRARVIAERYEDDAVALSVRALPADLERWRRLVPPPPEIATVADLLAAARRHGLELHAQTEDFDRTGLDFLVAHAHDGDDVRWIVRTPRRPDVWASSRIEARVLRLVRSHLPVAVPEWRVHARDVIAYPRLAGVPAVTVDRDVATRDGPTKGPTWNVIDPAAPCDAFVDSFAEALAALQAIPVERARLAGVPVRGIDAVRAELSAAIDATADALRPPEWLRDRWRRWLDDDRSWPEHLAMVHGDLHPGHMLLAPDGRLVGVLDWTEAQVTDPSVDFAMFHGCFGPEALRRLVTRFERASGRTWPRLLEHAAERWSAFPVLGAAWALRTGNEAVLAFVREQIASAKPVP